MMSRPHSSLPVLSMLVRLAWVVAIGAEAISAQDSEQPFFGIRVVDEETGRGVPMVELTTVHHMRLVTDSAGWVAFEEPGMMNREVFFHVESHGYQFPEDGFGFRGFRANTIPGKTTTVKIKRSNLAERLYRLTGQGIYNHSLRLGRSVPIKHPVLNGQVLGQDTVQSAIWKDRIFWVWGDTNRPSYPLGQFKTSAATSKLPSAGGLDPDVGIDLEYFVDANGFSRPVAPVEGPGAVWLHGLFVLDDPSSPELVAHYARVKSLTERLEHGLVRWNDQQQVFEKWIELPDDAMLYPRGQAMVASTKDQSYIYFATPFPIVRVRSRQEDICDPVKYQAYTCLQPGSRYDLSNPRIERNEQGGVVWDWKTNTDTVNSVRQLELIRNGKLKLSQAKLHLMDANTEQPIYLHSGSVQWNDYRKRWIMLGLQFGGEHSFIGDMWFAESDNLEGPWQNPRRILTHDKYSFYNPAHHPFFDQQDGRVIYFQGTYTNMFSKAAMPTPQYNYNQIMYRLDLGHPRMELPARE